MIATDERVLRFERFPNVRSGPQRDVDRHLWKIIKIEAPYCWATSHGADAGFVRYRIEVTRNAGASYPPRMSAEQRRL